MEMNVEKREITSGCKVGLRYLQPRSRAPIVEDAKSIKSD